MELVSTEIIAVYKRGDYFVEICKSVEDPTCTEAWLYKKNIGIKVLIFGVNEPCDLIGMVECFLSEDIHAYEELYCTE